jgi:DNA-binding MurR/RpiR family transcriptional regulator
MNSLIFLIESKLNTLPNSERKVADYILKQKKNVIYQRISEIAAETGSSPSAVMRLCRNLGIPGFQELKIMLARDVFGVKENNHGEEKSAHDFLEGSQILQTIESNINGLDDLKKYIDNEAIEKAVSLLEQSTYLFSFGLGLSGSIAFDFCHKMERLGYLCGFSQDIHMQMVSANNMTSGMTGMVISHSGTTPEIVKIAKIAKTKGAAMITITGNRHSDVADICDVVLLVPFSEPAQRFGASSSRIVQLTIIDILFSELIRCNPPRYIDKMAKTVI